MARLPVHLPRALVVVHPALTRRKEAPVQAMAVLGGEDALGFLVVEPGEPRRQVVEAEVLVEAVEPGVRQCAQRRRASRSWLAA